MNYDCYNLDWLWLPLVHINRDIDSPPAAAHGTYKSDNDACNHTQYNIAMDFDIVTLCLSSTGRDRGRQRYQEV